MKRAAILCALALAGCLQGAPSGDIPCDGDESCPTGYWCDSSGSCAELSKSSPPALEVAGVARGKDGPFGPEVSVPTGTVSFFELELKNTGGAEAAYPDITLQGPDCLHLGTAYFNAILEPGDAAPADVDVDPDASCLSPATVQVTLSLTSAGEEFTRTFTGSFTVDLTTGT